MNSYNYEDDFNVYSSFASKYTKKKKKLMSFVLIVFCFILIIGVFFCLFFMENVYKDKYLNFDEKVSIVFQDDKEGAEISSFEKYASFNTSFEYSFYIKNSNSFEIPYNVYINTVGNFSKNNFINYSLYKNDIIIFNGLFLNEKSFEIINSKVSANSIDNFKIKIWSAENLDYNFKISINLLNQ